MRTLAINIALSLLLILVLDSLAYFWLPDRQVATFRHYRRTSAPGVGGIAAYPHDYFVASDRRGFDIGRNRSGTHWVSGKTHAIWSNSLGCFDREHPPGEDYVYFAGDSFTWGYTPYEDNYGTLVEKQSGRSVFKCGVSHTGQRHQYDKMLEVTGEYGRMPRAIFVFHLSNNDLANDAAYPQATVIDGWLINQATVDDDDGVVRLSRDVLSARLANKLQQIHDQDSGQAPPITRLKQLARHYSLTANLLESLKDRLFAGNRTDANGQDTAAADEPLLTAEHDGRLYYTDNPYAQANKQALLAFRDYAVANRIELVVVLIPARRELEIEGYKTELWQFLADNGIRYFDLAPALRNSGATTDTLYWWGDQHFSPAGNRAVARILLDNFSDILH